jgi:hypothetical protein
VDLLSDRLERLEKVLKGDNITAIQEIMFLERAAFDSLQRAMGDDHQSSTSVEVEPVYEKIMALTRIAEQKVLEIETKLKQVHGANGKLKKFAAAEKIDSFVFKSV